MTTTGELAAPPVPELPAPWSIRLAGDEPGDADLIRRWMARPHVVPAWEQAWPLERWQQELDTQRAGLHSRPCLVGVEQGPVAYVELYRVDRDRLAGRYPHRRTDLGVHIAIGDPARCGRGLGRTLLRVVAEGLLAADPDCTRVVAEPDELRVNSVRAFTHAGYVPSGTVEFPEKTAILMVFPRSPADLP